MDFSLKLVDNIRYGSLFTMEYTCTIDILFIKRHDYPILIIYLQELRP